MASTTLAQQRKISKVLREFKAGTLKSSSGEKIVNPRRALAIALSEAGMTRKPKKDQTDEYYMGFFKEIAGEEEEEGEEEMDESAGEARCRGYLKTVAKNKKKK